MHDKQEQAVAYGKMAGAIGGASVAGLSTNELVQIVVGVLTGIFVLMQIGLLIPKYVNAYKKWRSGKCGE